MSFNPQTKLYLKSGNIYPNNNVNCIKLLDIFQYLVPQTYDDECILPCWCHIWKLHYRNLRARKWYPSLQVWTPTWQNVTNILFYKDCGLQHDLDVIWPVLLLIVNQGVTFITNVIHWSYWPDAQMGNIICLFLSSAWVACPFSSLYMYTQHSILISTHSDNLGARLVHVQYPPSTKVN